MIYSGAVAILAQGISKHLLSGIDHHHHHHHYHHHQHHYRHHHHHHHRVVHNDVLIRCSDESLTLSTIVSQLQIHPKTAQKSSKIFPKRCKNIQKKFQKPIREGKASQKHLWARSVEMFLCCSSTASSQNGQIIDGTYAKAMQKGRKKTTSKK